MGNKFSNMTENDLVESFLEYSREQAYFNEELDISGYNKISKKLDKISRELSTRAGDGRHLLLARISDPNLQVKLNIAVYCRELAPELVKGALNAVAATNRAPFAFHARMALVHMEKGWMNVASPS